jgi:YidC/Oxa1 family membrane protein insertase
MEEKQHNLSTFIGLGLIFLLLYLWMQFAAPPKPAEQQKESGKKTEQAAGKNAATGSEQINPAAPLPDSVLNSRTAARFGAFAPAAAGREQSFTLENDKIRVTFNSKGGAIKEVFLKNYFKVLQDSAGKETKVPVRLLEDSKNRFEYQIPVSGAAEGKVNTRDLYFTGTKESNTLVLRAPAVGGGYLEQRYTLNPESYDLDYRLQLNGLQDVIPAGKNIRLEWVNFLDKLEVNQAYERTMSSVYFKTAEESPDYCDCRSDAVEDLGDKPVHWMSHSNQFFNTALIARNFNFRNFVGETQMRTDTDEDLKVLKSSALIPIENAGSAEVKMTLYSGPNEFSTLHNFGLALEDIIPYGASIFGTINRWVIHPLFDFLSVYIGNMGIVILILTLIVKLLVYPLTYRMVYSQAKMSALKPRLDELRKKHGDDQQAMSVETMKMYSEFGVNPLGGCFPILLQMPIWFALYRFFPAAIEFRQAPFLWATDLSSYDVAFRLGFSVPGLGDHISAFTFIWVVTTLWYTWYNMKQMDTGAMNANPALKYMQYIMPVMFMFFFNSFASGLTTYLCFSNLLNIGQTVVTKAWFIDHDKIREKLEANRAKPKKSGGWRERFEQALKEQQRVQAEREKQQKKK